MKRNIILAISLLALASMTASAQANTIPGVVTISVMSPIQETA